MSELSNSPFKDRLGCSTITFRDQSLSDALKSIRDSGLRKVDIACIPGFCPHIDPLNFSASELAELKDRLSSDGMTVSTLNVSAGGLNTEQGEFVFSFNEAAIPLAAKLGCYAITVPTGRKVADRSQWQKNAEVSSAMIRRLADRAAKEGVVLTLEAPHVGTLAEDAAEAAAFYKVLADPRVLCTFDTSHVARGNPTPVEKLVAGIGAPIGHLHLRDCIGDNNHLTPGKGDIDFAAVIAEIDGRGYKGDIILELEGEDAAQAAGELAYSIRHIASLK